MKAAYEQDTYAGAKTALLTICTDLDSKGYHSAANNSLREGLERHPDATPIRSGKGVAPATANHESHRACEQPDQAVDGDGCTGRGTTTE